MGFSCSEHCLRYLRIIFKTAPMKPLSDISDFN
jgi:hypothetical protein